MRTLPREVTVIGVLILAWMACGMWRYRHPAESLDPDRSPSVHSISR